MHTEHPPGVQDSFPSNSKPEHPIGRLKTRRYMKRWVLQSYTQNNLSKPAQGHKIFPYLLRSAVITRPNQAWSIDITYIRLEHGFVYLTAIIDWYSRCIVGWEIDDTLATPMVLKALEKALSVSKPEILNSDQGSQFTGHEYIEFLQKNKVQISMDGKKRWADNIMIERWFRTLKCERVYLKDYKGIRDARTQIGAYHNYNFERLHSALDYRTPASMYYPALLGLAA